MNQDSNELITVVVPVKNRHRLIIRCLESIKAQTWRPIRVVVVDNGSTDGTPQAVASWAEQNHSEGFAVDLAHEREPGPSAARDRGVEEVDSRLMMHFDSDDTMEPTHIETVMKRFAAADYPDLVCFRVRYHDLKNRTTLTHSGKGSMMEKHLIHSLLRTQGYACETALLRRVGGWNRRLVGWEDYELGVRLLLEARQRAYIPDVNVDVYSREDSVTGKDFTSKAGNWEMALDAVEQNLERSLHRKRKRWLRLVPYRRMILAAEYAREGNMESAKSLREKALASQHVSALQRLYLKLAYHYVRLGGRGAYKLFV